VRLRNRSLRELEAMGNLRHGPRSTSQIQSGKGKIYPRFLILLNRQYLVPVRCGSTTTEKVE
jgi:hypothetical protein